MDESEYKCMIDNATYQDIIKKLDVEYSGKRTIQVNYYYDTKDFILDKNDITFRIRQRDKRLNIEIKYPLSKDGLLRINNEVVCSIDKLPNSINMSKSNILNCFDRIQKIILLGNLVTDRISYCVNKGIKVDIDKSYYYGVADYEMKIEFEENMRQESLALLEKLTIGRCLIPQSSKRERFIYRFKQIQRLSFQM